MQEGVSPQIRVAWRHADVRASHAVRPGLLNMLWFVYTNHTHAHAHAHTHTHSHPATQHAPVGADEHRALSRERAAPACAGQPEARHEQAPGAQQHPGAAHKGLHACVCVWWRRGAVLASAPLQSISGEPAGAPVTGHTKHSRDVTRHTLTEKMM
jgi:hypothetical protein